MSRSTSSSRSLSSATSTGLSEPGCGRWTKSFSRRLVIDGPSRASPLAVSRMAWARLAGEVSLRRKPLAPARMAA